ncbi:Ribulose kinase and related carbohydrate kinases [Phaffia rhodozyma]|uniref:Ribulose kinase and related carbohydrate kinases n=1 Tax=Phaffia rhodozyma TaxID=264483 RepID=A0A0F7SS90_PHARH|nr:Ribulose kinase and related carbohydrate kinases [Phaffia rhodozyma]
MSNTQSQGPYFIGFDVGTGSARAALLDTSGKLLAESTHQTITFRDPKDHTIFEQSLTDIWDAIRKSSLAVLESSGVSKSDIRGVGFDATCSLAVTDLEGKPVEVSKGENLGLALDHGNRIGEDRSMILWADHRAEEEAKLINSTGHVVLDYVGGTMSLEMEIPKTLWLKKHMKADRFKNCQFFDLPDYLTYRSTGSLARSSNSLVSKFSYIPPDASESAPSSKGPHPKSDGWNEEFLRNIGLESVVERGLGQIGGKTGESLDVKGDGSDNGESLVLTAGLPVGKGLDKRAAEELGLLEGTAVGSGVIDAYAGWVGTIAARSTDMHDSNPDVTLQNMAPPNLVDSTMRLAAVAGTSTCYIVQSPEGVFVDGVWGPYKNAIFPGYWMNEGGQSSTGQLIDFMITTHPAYPQLLQVAKDQGTNIHEVLGDKLEELRVERGVKTLTHLTKDLHLYPDLHGNRSPLADNRMRGSIVGLALDSTLGDLALKFNVTLEAIALQTRHILEEMNSKGHKIDSIYMSGGQVKNKRLMSLLSSVCRIPVILPPSSSAAVVSGSAMLGRFAAEVSEKLGQEPISSMEMAKKAGKGMNERLWEIMVEMTPPGARVEPEAEKDEMALLDVKYEIFRESIDIQKKWRKMIADVTEA